MINIKLLVAVTSLSIYHNEYDGEEKNYPVQESSANADNKVRLKSILKKSK